MDDPEALEGSPSMTTQKIPTYEPGTLSRAMNGEDDRSSQWDTAAAVERQEQAPEPARYLGPQLFAVSMTITPVGLPTDAPYKLDMTGPQRFIESAIYGFAQAFVADQE